MSLSARERGRLVRALAEREHLAPDGRWVRVGRNTLDRWIRAYREGGFDGLVPAPRRIANATPERLLELAVALRREQPARTAAQIHRILVEAEGAAPSARTIQRHLAAAGLPWKGSLIARALGRFEAECRNELWTAAKEVSTGAAGHRSRVDSVASGTTSTWGSCGPTIIRDRAAGPASSVCRRSRRRRHRGSDDRVSPAGTAGGRV